ncbi:hypothetical protein QAD02_012600 [Eretmocerus hayati]|uniref:Uncharacterized protein n=1 Tax=Eretmocerus hayati TaxID=131215 RepID=A0ACC2P120_9HYME|nr:hypothetical protein QAD02_012600 [Eretmocerus hayati]
MPNKLQEGFVRADSGNSPTVSGTMIYIFIKSDERFNQPEVCEMESGKSSRESYGDAAVGHVCLKRDNKLCTVKARMSPEHRTEQTPYSVTVIVDEDLKKIVEISCDGCAAGPGGCKHVFAFLMWFNRRSEEPARTEIECYWKESVLSGVGKNIPFILAAGMLKDKKRVNQPLTSDHTFKKL